MRKVQDKTNKKLDIEIKFKIIFCGRTFSNVFNYKNSKT